MEDYTETKDDRQNIYLYRETIKFMARLQLKMINWKRGLNRAGHGGSCL